MFFLTRPARRTYTCFDGPRLLATGSLPAVALQAKGAQARDGSPPALIFDNLTGRTVEVDLRGTDAEVVERLKLAHGIDEDLETSPLATAGAASSADASRGRGRPKLGVIPREVTLLPRHWEWLAAQPGGASVALRKLVEQARRTHAGKDRIRETQERTYHFISALAGDLPGFEEASRALFANNLPKFEECMAPWPADWREHALWLASDHEETMSA
jgi:hypothetical protein